MNYVRTSKMLIEGQTPPRKADGLMSRAAPKVVGSLVKARAEPAFDSGFRASLEFHPLVRGWKLPDCRHRGIPFALPLLTTNDSPAPFALEEQKGTPYPVSIDFTAGTSRRLEHAYADRVLWSKRGFQLRLSARYPTAVGKWD